MRKLFLGLGLLVVLLEIAQAQNIKEHCMQYLSEDICIIAKNEYQRQIFEKEGDTYAA